MRHLGIVSVTALLLSGALSPPAALADDDGFSIVNLAFRDHVVTVKSSPEGPRYSVRTSTGTLLSEDLADAQLLAAHPELHSRIHASYASDESGGFVWAGRSASQVEPPIDTFTHSE